MSKQTKKRSSDGWYVDVNDPRTIKAFERLFKAIEEDTTEEDYAELERYEEQKNRLKLLKGGKHDA